MILGTSACKNGLRATIFRPEIDARIVLAGMLAIVGTDAGLQWGDAAARLASRFPARREGASGDAVSADCRALGVPSVDVKSAGKALKGCRAADVQAAAGAQ